MGGADNLIDPEARIDPTADVGADAAIGAGATVGARTSIGQGSRIGAGATVGRDVFVESGVVIGDRVEVHHGALIYRGTTVEDDVLIGPGAILARDRYPRAVTSTVEGAAGADTVSDTIVVQQGASIGAGAVVLAGVDVGRNALVGAGAIVTRDVAEHALVAGNPAKRLGWVCVCANRLLDSDGNPAPAKPAHYASDSALHCRSCGRVYAYVPDAETVREASGPRTEIPA